MQPCRQTVVLFAGLLAGLVASTRPAAAQDAAPAAPPCPAAFEPQGELADRFEQASQTVRACVDAGRITPRAGRRGLSAIEELRELALYDERRAWGTSSARRERLYDLRLRWLMAATLR